LLTGVEIPDQNFMFQHYKDILLSGEMVEYWIIKIYTQTGLHPLR
jgi:hypothetical protein